LWTLRLSRLRCRIGVSAGTPNSTSGIKSPIHLVISSSARRRAVLSKFMQYYPAIKSMSPCHRFGRTQLCRWQVQHQCSQSCLTTNMVAANPSDHDTPLKDDGSSANHRCCSTASSSQLSAIRLPTKRRKLSSVMTFNSKGISSGYFPPTSMLSVQPICKHSYICKWRRGWRQLGG